MSAAQHLTTEHAAREPRATILIVDDSDSLRRNVRTTVEAMGLFDTIHEARDGFAAFRMMRDEAIDVVLCDLEMPNCNGLDLLRLRAQVPKCADIPLLMLTSSEDMEVRIRVLTSGASDYVCKPAHPEELRARLSVHLRLKQAHDQLLQKSGELDRLARTDELTKLPNRRHLNEVAEREHSRCSRYRRPMSVLMLDLDRFKHLNDTYGHAVGDQVLAAVASTLREQVRGADLAARYGGEEFAVVMPETLPSEAHHAAERIRKAIEAIDLQSDGKPLSVSASIGVAGMPSVHVACAADLFARADEALYAAKRAGRNCVVAAGGAPIELAAIQEGTPVR